MAWLPFVLAPRRRLRVQAAKARCRLISGSEVAAPKTSIKSKATKPQIFKVFVNSGAKKHGQLTRAACFSQRSRNVQYRAAAEVFGGREGYGYCAKLVSPKC